MPARTKKNGLIYLRRSSGRQETSLATQLKWAIDEAQKLGVRVDVDMNDLEHMQSHRLHSFKSIRLDDAITGADLERPGFLAIMTDAVTDKSVSHVFVYRRDRLGRPEDAFLMASREKSIRQHGVTFVMSDKVAGPQERGQSELGGDITMWFDYYESGEFLKKHAERVIIAKIFLAKDGFWTGGPAPYGFVRVLVDSTGNVVEELMDGRKVRQQGCHVRIMPKDKAKISVWCLILALKRKGWGGKRIASHLNALGIPSPNAGRERTDHGTKHYVSGKWHINTILDLCRNQAIIGNTQLGRRSEGGHRRISFDGPRLLTESDRTPEGLPRLVQNEQHNTIVAKTGFEPSFDAEKWHEISEQMEIRGRSQRGISRTKDPLKYPLSTRVIDQTDGCGAIMYARSSDRRRSYVCSRYMRTCSAECDYNSVDAEALLKFVMGTNSNDGHTR